LAGESQPEGKLQRDRHGRHPGTVNIRKRIIQIKKSRWNRVHGDFFVCAFQFEEVFLGITL
jgi:hypothetical protein